MASYSTRGYIGASRPLKRLSRENTKYYCPRIHGNYTDAKTDIFALGSTIYSIMMGHQLKPLIDKVCEEASIMKPDAILSKTWDFGTQKSRREDGY
ncbi:hypothetical protein N7522_006097 [Penicillium canescens]|nr:hypothetical protein N7522_006097 [Penicillium canescens]